MMFTTDCLSDIPYYSIFLYSHRRCVRILCEEFVHEDFTYFRTNFPAGINVDYGECLLGTRNLKHYIVFSGQNFANKVIKE